MAASGGIRAIVGAFFANLGIAIAKFVRFTFTKSSSMLAESIRSLLLGEAATPDNLAKIETALTTSPGVTRIIHLRTQHIGPEGLLVGTKVSFEPGLDTRGLAAAIAEAERRVRAEVPMAYPMHIEPALYDAHDEAQ